MEFSVAMPEEDGLIKTPSGDKYILQTLLQAVDAFNERCPKKGGLLIRDHIGHIKEHTHITHSLKYEDGKLIAEIELLRDGLEKFKIKPIIKTPLRLGSRVLTERLLGVVNIFLED
jgi:hypothetical protein